MAEERADDSTIEDTEVLWRLAHPSNIHIKNGTPRPQSVLFIDRDTGEMSVVISSMTTLDDFKKGFPEHSVVAVTAKDVRGLGYRVCRDPIPGNPAHAVIVPKMSRSNARKLAAKATLIHSPNPPE